MNIPVLYIPALSDVASSMDTSTPLVDRMAIGIEISLLGLATVFIVLILLMIFLNICKYIFYTLPNKRRNNSIKEAELPVGDTENSETISDSLENDNADETEIIAVITAAVAAYMDDYNGDDNKNNENTEKNNLKFKVVSFKKVTK